MIVSGVALAAFALVLLLSASADGPAAKDGLEILKPVLPDGRVWRLAEGGIGRPFLARLILVNRSKKPIVVWDHENTEGSLCPSVELVDAAGARTILKPEVVERAGGGPTSHAIPPDGTRRIDLELLRLIGERSPAPGTYRLRLLYENELGSRPGFPDVWTGRIASEPAEIRIEAPKRP